MNPEYENMNTGEEEVERVRRHVESVRMKIQELEKRTQSASAYSDERENNY